MEVFLHDGVMRAAKDQVFDLFAGKDVVDLRADLGVDVVLVEIAAVDECRKQGRALADDLALGRILVDELGVFAGGNGEPYSDLHTSQTAFAVQVAVPPVQLLVSVCEASRLQIRVWVFSSLFCVQSPQS